MQDSSSELSRVEARLKIILEIYGEARVRGDFLETVLAVHTALEEALDIRLGEQTDGLSFSQKFECLLPDLFQRYSVDQLNRRRNHYGHPKQHFADAEIRDTAARFVDLATEAWPGLFFTHPPKITHPDPQSVARTASAVSDAQIREKDAHIERLRRRVQELEAASSRQPPPPRSLEPQPSPREQPSSSSSRSSRPMPWRSLLMGPVWLSCAVILFWSGAGMWQSTQAVSAWVLVLVLLGLFTGFVGLRHVWRLLYGLGWRRLLVASTVVGVLVMVYSLIFAPRSDSRSMAPPASPKPVVQTEPAVVQTAPTPRPRVTPAGIVIGARVKVRTNGAPLLSRAAPGTDQPVVARLSNGSELAVLEGPASASGLTWWKVKGESGTGWSAAQFLVPAAQ